MRFSAYFIKFSHSQANFTGNVQIAGKSVAANFSKISDDLFAAHFKNQVEFSFRQEIDFKNVKGRFTVLLPVLSQYNQRKLKKLAEILRSIQDKAFREIILALLTVENFLEVESLLYFFSLERSAAAKVLIELELARQLKVINLNYLFVTSWEHFLQNLAAMESGLRQAYEGRERTLKFTQLEKTVKIPQETIFFKYLLTKCSQEFPCKVLPNMLIFSKLPLMGEEKTRMADIEKTLKANKLLIFTIENVQKNTDYSLKQINDSLWYMLDEEKFLQLDERHFIFSDEYNKIINRLKKFKRNQGDILTFDDLRAVTSYSRKYLIVLFEYWDGHNITRRVGNKRQILLGV
ncbi:MAG: SelB C-terminal domain-containing protein [Chrysiogenia bacterium]